jgi:hypothetical protein
MSTPTIEKLVEFKVNPRRGAKEMAAHFRRERVVCRGCNWDTGTKTSLVCQTCLKQARQLVTIKPCSTQAPSAVKGRGETEEAKKGISAPNRGIKGPNRTESAYQQALEFEFADFSDLQVIYEGITLKLKNGARYTPDFVVMGIYGHPLLVEVKNSAYKHASYGRSHMAFNQAKLDYPIFQYRWVEKTQEGWTIK